MGGIAIAGIAIAGIAIARLNALGFLSASQVPMLFTGSGFDSLFIYMSVWTETGSC